MIDIDEAVSPDLARILDIIDTIPEAMCAAPQPRFLYELSLRSNGPGAIVEIGTCAGKSTIALAAAQKAIGGTRLHTVDIITHPAIEANLARAGVTAYVNRIVKPSREVAMGWNAPVRLLWIDGDHAYKGVLHDILDWSPFVMPGGIMAFHDHPSPGGKELGGVGRAVYETVFCRPDRWRVVVDREAGSILAVQRLATDGDALSYAAPLWQRGRHAARHFAGRVVRKAGRMVGR